MFQSCCVLEIQSAEIHMNCWVYIKNSRFISIFYRLLDGFKNCSVSLYCLEYSSLSQRHSWTDAPVFIDVISAFLTHVVSTVRRSVAEPIAAQIRINVDVQPFP